MTDLVVLSLERWDQVWRRNQHLVAGLLRTDPELRVLFVEPAADPVHDLASRRRPGTGQGVTEVGAPAPGRLWTCRPTKWLPRRFDSRADERLAASVVRAARSLGMGHPLLWINDPGAVELAERTGWPTLYDVTDDWLAADRSEGERARASATEARLLEVAREVVVCSPELARRKGAARPVTLIPNGVDAAAYRRPAPRPADLPEGRVALYLGTAHPDRIDVDLCEATARALTAVGATLVLVGPNLLGDAATARLESAGAALLGPRPSADVVGHLQHADALVVPHVVTPFTDSLDPIKLYEYQAVGRPVVSTPVAGFRDVADPRVAIAARDAFPAAVASAVELAVPFPHGVDGPASDWSERVSAMRGVLERLGEPDTA
ncbi:glycosyltransferase [Agromyces sp. SYSU T00266]|uniref:glycosyltransferase n=1 Tax=Agromyces zhanjiangensis TaxID=3158562 RepID=UPI0033998E20